MSGTFNDYVYWKSTLVDLNKLLFPGDLEIVFGECSPHHCTLFFTGTLSTQCPSHNPHSSPLYANQMSKERQGRILYTMTQSLFFFSFLGFATRGLGRGFSSLTLNADARSSVVDSVFARRLNELLSLSA